MIQVGGVTLQDMIRMLRLNRSVGVQVPGTDDSVSSEMEEGMRKEWGSYICKKVVCAPFPNSDVGGHGGPTFVL